jgi:ketosteroid isomerase-like protein
MSQENVEMVRRAYDAWNSQQALPALEAYLSPDFEFVNPDYAIEPGTRRGYQGLVAVVEAVDAAFAEYSHDPHELIDAGDKVLALVTFRARGRQGGVEMRVDEQHVWTLEDGKVVRLEWFHDRREALEAAGLSEQEAHN